MSAPHFRTVALDADSTLSGIEGIDWLAALRGPKLAAEVAALTTAAMSGQVRLDEVYGRRLSMVAPTRDEVAALAQVYRDAVASGARACVAAMRRAGVRVLIVSGGVREALLPLARDVGVDDADVHAVAVRFGPNDAYAGFDAESPLARHDGKSVVLRTLASALPRAIVHVGDGVTDAVTRDVVDSFAAFTGFVTRDDIVARADFAVASFAELQARVL